MEINVTEMREKAAIQEAERREESRRGLESFNEAQREEREELQNILKRIGEKNAEQMRKAMDAEKNKAMEKAQAEVELKYEELGVEECDKLREPMKNMLGSLLSKKPFEK